MSYFIVFWSILTDQYDVMTCVMLASRHYLIDSGPMPIFCNSLCYDLMRKGEREEIIQGETFIQ